MLLSIIIPVYNVEQYLRKCLSSCVNQDIKYADYEIIIVNDGSPDNSSSIIEEFSGMYSNISVINKANGGLSSARNAGLALAKGDYVWFVDSDDWIEENCLSGIISILNGNYSIISLSTVMHTNNEKKGVNRNLPQEEIGANLIYKKSYFYPYSGVQFYLFNRQFLSEAGLLFKEGILFEDILFMPTALSHARSCFNYCHYVYNYNVRSNSITTTNVSDKKINDLFVVCDLLNVEKLKLETDNYIINESICRAFEVLFRYNILRIGRNRRRALLKQMIERKYWKQSLTSAKHIIYYIAIYTYYLFS